MKVVLSPVLRRIEEVSGPKQLRNGGEQVSACVGISFALEHEAAEK